MTHLIKGLKSIREALRRQKIDRKNDKEFEFVFLHTALEFGSDDLFERLNSRQKKGPAIAGGAFHAKNS
jgi:hypothetical protein